MHSHQTNLVARLRTIALQSSVAPEVSVWWLYGGDLHDFSTSETTDGRKESGRYFTSRKDHHYEWPKMVRRFPELKNIKYTAIPRGRVIYDSEARRSEVWGSPALLRSGSFRNLVINTFHLDKIRTVFVTSNLDVVSHYTGAQGATERVINEELMKFLTKHFDR